MEKGGKRKGVRRKWIQFVHVTRLGWSGRGPSRHTQSPAIPITAAKSSRNYHLFLTHNESLEVIWNAQVEVLHEG